MEVERYKFDCGCEFDIISKKPLRIKIVKEIGNDNNQIRKDCPAVWDFISTGQTKGIFQLSSHLGSMLSKKLKPKNMEQLAGLISISRPGCLEAILEDGKSATDHYIDRKNSVEKVEYFHPSLEESLKKTYGLLIYQEQILSIAKKIAGFSLIQADLLRRCIAKGSYIYTNHGPKKIEETTDKDRILTIDVNNKKTYKKIKRVWSTGEQQVYKLKTENGFDIELTENHSVYTQDGWKILKHLSINDFVCVPKKYVYKGNNFDLDECIILSYLTSEGYHTKNESKITNSDQWILDKIRNSLKNLGAEYKEYTNKNNNCIDIHIKGKYKKRLDDLVPHDKSRQKKIIKQITNSQESITRCYVGHYFSGDGSVFQDKAEFYSTSIDILKCIQAILLRNQIYSSIATKKSIYNNKPYLSYRLTISDFRGVLRFRELYKDYICPQKMEKLLNIEAKKYSNQKFLVPDCFVKSCTNDIGLSCIYANPCGSIYNKSLTYEKAKRLNQIINSEMLDEILNADFYFVKIGSIKKTRVIETFDYEVDDDKVHYGFVNGILVHNSIGKKKVDLMAKVKEDFIYGCEKTDIVNKEEADQIWDWIEKSQRYLFNKSHAVSYAYNTYIAAFDKSHLLKAFYVSNCVFSKKEQKPLDELNELVWDARQSGIDIYGPDIRIKNIDFKIKQGKIHYGLVNVKGVGSNAVKKIIEKINETEARLGKPIKDWCWYEFLFNINVSTNVFENLINAGALDFLGLSRRFMVHEFKVFCEINDREKTYIMDSGDICRFDSISDAIKVLITAPVGRNGGISNKNRFKKVEGILNLAENPPASIEDNASSIARSEKALLGVEISSTILDDKDISMANSTCRDVVSDNGRFNKSYLIGVCVEKVKEVKTKRGKNAGSYMGFIDCYDITGKISVTVFSDVYKEFKGLLVPGNTLLVSIDGGPKGNILKKAHQI